MVVTEITTGYKVGQGKSRKDAIIDAQERAGAIGDIKYLYYYGKAKKKLIKDGVFPLNKIDK